MKKWLKGLAATLTAVFTLGFAACGTNGTVEKDITVVVRENSSGTREAFDKVVNDGNGNYLQMKDENGKTVYTVAKGAITQTKTGNVLSSVANDKNAIGYISLGSVNASVNVVKVNGVAPSTETVLDGTYSIQRPFVILTNANVTLAPRAQDFVNYLYSGEMAEHAEDAGVIFLQDETQRANVGAEKIPVQEYTPLTSLPDGAKIVVRGSSSMEKLFEEAAAGYAAQYNTTADKIFDYELNGSSEGKKLAKEDKTGNAIGLSSSAVQDASVRSLNVCLDAVAVVVNKNNTAVTDLTLVQLYDIFSGKITKFSQL